MGELFLQSAKLRDAVKWWKLSADNGDSDAMMRLSQVLREGAIGVPQESEKWWDRWMMIGRWLEVCVLVVFFLGVRSELYSVANMILMTDFFCFTR